MEKKPKIMLIIRGAMHGVNSPGLGVSEQRFHVLLIRIPDEACDTEEPSYSSSGLPAADLAFATVEVVC
jgi:hypothetical protein